MDNEAIKQALDHFENDEFVNAKEILQDQINKSKNEFFKDKLGLKEEEKE